MIPTPIRQVLSTLRSSGVQALLMGGQACVFYGAAQVSKDIDLVLLSDPANYQKLLEALRHLDAKRIAVPPFEPRLLERGHAVHFRCGAKGVEDLRVDIMTRLPDLPQFAELWERRTVIADDSGEEFHLLSVPDLVQAKKTQRTRDWPVIELLVAIHYRDNGAVPRPDYVEFWLKEARTPELLVELAQKYRAEAERFCRQRPLLRWALVGNLEPLRAELDSEVRAKQAEDRAYWAPLKQELEAMRRAEGPGRE